MSDTAISENTVTEKPKRELDFSKHPCFNREAHNKYGRIHLPVAPRCNIQCNFCNRKFDCMNESRPGVTSSVLKPEQAIAYLSEVVAKRPEIAVTRNLCVQIHPRAGSSPADRLQWPRASRPARPV